MNTHNRNFDNRTLYHGDNLKFMRAMNSESVDLIATDPPFNKGKDFHATPDSLAAGAKFQDRWVWKRDVHEEWVDQIESSHPALHRYIKNVRETREDTAAFLCFLAVRLIAMHRILKPTGSIYLHCDPTASHYIKQVMDIVFGEENFRNEIVWCYSNIGKHPISRFPRKHDVIFFYGKSKSATLFNKQSYNHWRSGQPANPCDWWVDITSFNGYMKPKDDEHMGYPTQKPIALYERIIKTSSNVGDVVFDPFCGCATTLVAAERLNRQWVGIDLWPTALQLVKDRMIKETTGGIDPGLVDADITATDEPPKRTDDGFTAAPFMLVPESTGKMKGMNKKEAKAALVEKFGSGCQGCGMVTRSGNNLAIDHHAPKSGGGVDSIDNFMLLCASCNSKKSNKLTGPGLRQQLRRDHKATGDYPYIPQGDGPADFRGIAPRI